MDVQPEPPVLGSTTETIPTTSLGPLVVKGSSVVSSPLGTAFERVPSPLLGKHFAEEGGSPKRVSIPESLLLPSPEVEVTSAGDDVAGAFARAEKVVANVPLAEVATVSAVLCAYEEAVDEVPIDFRSMVAKSRANHIHKADNRLK